MGCSKLTYQNFNFLEVVHRKNATANFIFGLNGDHLNNTRLSYSDLNGDGSINPSAEILQERNFYPFGLEHKGYNSNIISENNYKNYQGEELDKSLDLNLHHFKFRSYDYVGNASNNIAETIKIGVK